MPTIHLNDMPCSGTNCLLCAHDFRESTLINMRYGTTTDPRIPEAIALKMYVPVLERVCELAPDLFEKEWIENPPEHSPSSLLFEYHSICKAIKEKRYRDASPHTLEAVVRSARQHTSGDSEGLRIQAEILHCTRFIYAKAFNYNGTEKESLAQTMINVGAETPFLAAIRQIRTHLIRHLHEKNVYAQKETDLALLETETLSRSPTNRALAVAMGVHGRLGCDSLLMRLGSDIVCNTLVQFLEPIPQKLIMWGDVFAEILNTSE